MANACFAREKEGKQIVGAFAQSKCSRDVIHLIQLNLEWKINTDKHTRLTNTKCTMSPSTAKRQRHRSPDWNDAHVGKCMGKSIVSTAPHTGSKWTTFETETKKQRAKLIRYYYYYYLILETRSIRCCRVWKKEVFIRLATNFIAIFSLVSIPPFRIALDTIFERERRSICFNNKNSHFADLLNSNRKNVCFFSHECSRCNCKINRNESDTIPNDFGHLDSAVQPMHTL